ncbi:class I SAM-dependent methyltransferase [Treponema sp.]|uniref:class I SAM-dependent methyltransferase n=1 Tax=Treponema sp. TaxID=166 RepID=UPI002580FDEC|nr:class I SAM-dependent methyltransferase [Treponema sp.]MBE6354593.1 class I SAM-dependent methyltransferase [Treponema sp.]
MTELEKYYNKFNEDHRLTTRHGTVEFEVALYRITKHLEMLNQEKNSIKIADIGAGTGRYSIALSRMGYDVTAVELVKNNLNKLLNRHEKVKCWQGDARNLSFLDSEKFDVTILFGPLYHLHGKEKLKALNEAKRITKKGGLIFTAHLLNEYAVITYGFIQGNIQKCLENGSISKEFICRDGENELYSYTSLEDIKQLDSDAGLIQTEIFSPDGPSDFMRRELNAMDEETFRLFIEYQKKNCLRPELLGASSHIVDVLRK